MLHFVNRYAVNIPAAPSLPWNYLYCLSIQLMPGIKYKARKPCCPGSLTQICTLLNFTRELF